MVDQCVQIPKQSFNKATRLNECEFEMPAAIKQLPQSDSPNSRVFVTPEGYKAAKALVNQVVGTVSCSFFWANFSCLPVVGSREATIQKTWELLATIASARHRMSCEFAERGKHFIITTGDVRLARTHLEAANDVFRDNSQNNGKMCFNSDEVDAAIKSFTEYAFPANWFAPLPMTCDWDRCQAALRCNLPNNQIHTEK